MNATNLYAGLTALRLPHDMDEFDLGQGLVLHRTFAHLMSSYTMAFKPPEAPGKHHPAPWKATTRHDGFDVHTELVIPAEYKPPGNLAPFEVARTITGVVRLTCDPGVRFLVQASHSLSEAANIPDREIRISPVEATQHTASSAG
jgi:hypothetical protein